MRKGLVTLGVVALVLAVTPGFTEAPLLSCLPDIVISDVEQNTQTDDLNLFVFSDAIDLDEYVNDADTPTSALRWTFIETTTPGNTIEINGIASNPAVDVVEPGVDDIRAVSNMASFKNAAWYGTDPGAGATDEAMIEMYVSDGTSVSHQTMVITTVNADFETGDPDAVVPSTEASYNFDSGAQGWTFFSITSTAPPIQAAGQSATNGALRLTESAPHEAIIFGAWESPRDPTVAVAPKLGGIMRARYQVSTEGVASPTESPGVRMRGLTSHVSQQTGTWEQDFANQDFTSTEYVTIGTIDFQMAIGGLDGRVPGTGQEYQLLVFPRQVAETLLSEDPDSPVVMYFSYDVLDLEGQTSLTGNADAGTHVIDSVVIDCLDRPEIGTGTAVPEMSFSDFSTGWSTGIKDLGTGTRNDGGLVVTAGADVSITVATGNQHFDAYAEMTDGVSVEAGRTYRLAFWCTSSETGGGTIKGPTVRVHLTSTRFVYTAVKELSGGALISRLTSTPSLMELWVLAPAADTTQATAGVTEPMKATFESYLAANAAAWPDFRTVEGTVTLTDLETEVFDF